MDKKDNVIAVYPSKTKPGLEYYLSIGDDQVPYCTCGPWKFQRVPPKDRKPCGHINKYFGGKP